MDIFISALAGGAALSAASAPVTGIFGGLGALVTLTSDLGAPDEANDRLVAEEALNMVRPASSPLLFRTRISLLKTDLDRSCTRPPGEASEPFST